ncbi:hypothetical protein B0H19DRAFT_1346050 [Mycena capillaripes]|nr:hypothetical protein B0H19DRAFT_1346050 [Mycena capillaripes]
MAESGGERAGAGDVGASIAVAETVFSAHTGESTAGRGRAGMSCGGAREEEGIAIKPPLMASACKQPIAACLRRECEGGRKKVSDDRRLSVGWKGDIEAALTRRMPGASDAPAWARPESPGFGLGSALKTPKPSPSQAPKSPGFGPSRGFWLVNSRKWGPGLAKFQAEPEPNLSEAGPSRAQAEKPGLRGLRPKPEHHYREPNSWR